MKSGTVPRFRALAKSLLLRNKDTTGTIVSCPVYGSVLILEDSDSLYTYQCEGLQMEQSNGVLFSREVSAFQRCP